MTHYERCTRLIREVSEIETPHVDDHLEASGGRRRNISFLMHNVSRVKSTDPWVPGGRDVDAALPEMLTTEGRAPSMPTQQDLWDFFAYHQYRVAAFSPHTPWTLRELKAEAANPGTRAVTNSIPLAENLHGTALENSAFINHVARVLGQPQPALRARLAHDIDNAPALHRCTNPHCHHDKSRPPVEDHQFYIDPYGEHGPSFARQIEAHNAVVDALLAV